MKFSFSDKFVKSGSFIELCNIAQDYGFDGIKEYTFCNNGETVYSVQQLQGTQKENS